MAEEGRRKWLDRIAKADRTVERIADAPANLVDRGRPISDSAKRDLWEKGVDGIATVPKAPSKHRVSKVRDNVGRFTVRVAIADEELYEATVWQEFMADEWKRMQPGSDRITDSSQLIVTGRRAIASVLSSKPMGKRAPGTEDEFYLLDLELFS